MLVVTMSCCSKDYSSIDDPVLENSSQSHNTSSHYPVLADDETDISTFEVETPSTALPYTPIIISTYNTDSIFSFSPSPATTHVTTIAGTEVTTFNIIATTTSIVLTEVPDNLSATEEPDKTVSTVPTNVVETPTQVLTPTDNSTLQPKITASATPLPTSVKTPSPTISATAVHTQTTVPSGTPFYTEEISELPTPKYESKGFTYMRNPDYTLTITGKGTCTDVDLVIPEKIDGFTVSKIGENAFAGHDELMSVVFPDTITEIGRSAFENCIWLRGELTLPESVTIINQGSFGGCPNITSLKTYGAISISGFAFYNCTGLETLFFYSSAYIKDSAFENCKKIETVAFFSSCSITDKSFNFCRKIQHSYWNDDRSFKEHFNKLSAVAHNGLDGVDNGFFYSVLDSSGNEKEIVILGMVPNDDTNIIIPETINGYTVVEIGEKAFYDSYNSLIGGPTSIITYILPPGLKRIGRFAFSFSGITEMTIPKNVYFIDEMVFLGCCFLEKLSVDSQNTHYYSSNNCLIESQSQKLIYGCFNCIIPIEVKQISNRAFGVPNSSMEKYVIYYAGDENSWKAIKKPNPPEAMGSGDNFYLIYLIIYLNS